jgi:hypothetical protein
VKNWDLNAGAARLELALEALRKTTAEVGESWSDQTYEDFRQSYLVPLEPKVRTALDAVHRLEQILGRARRECDSS